MYGRLRSNPHGQSSIAVTKTFISHTTRLRCSPFIEQFEDVGAIFHTVGLAMTDAAVTCCCRMQLLAASASSSHDDPSGGRADSDESTVIVTTQAGSTAAATF